MSLREIIERVNGSRATLTLLNPDVPPAAVERIHDYLDVQHVRVRQDETRSGTPKNVAVLHDDDGFVAASDLRAVDERADLQAAIASDFEDVPIPDVLAAIDDRTFSEFGKRRMILASREIEQRAYEAGSGRLHAGFQRLSLVEDQRRIYEKLGREAVETHVYGYPDWEVPDGIDVEVHPSDDEEIRRTWFVVFDGDGDDEAKCALLAEEVGQNVYSGFWTSRADIVDAILAQLTEISR